MATTIDLVKKDFEQVFPSLFQNGKVELTVEDLLETSNTLILEELEFLKGTSNVVEKERLILIDFIKLMDEAEDPVDYDESINQRLCYYIKAYPGIKSFEFFQLRYRVTHYGDGGLDCNKLAEYYKDIFDSQSELILLNDFFERSDFLIPVLLMVDPSNDLVSTFQFAVNKYPGKVLLKFTLGRIFEMRKEYQKSLLWHYHFAGQVESDRTCNVFINEYYHIAISNIASLCFYKIKDYENASIYSEVCLSEFRRNGEDVYSFQVLFLDPILIRLRLSMHNKENEEFKQNYRLLRSKIDDVDFSELDIDDVKEFAKGLKM